MLILLLLLPPPPPPPLLLLLLLPLLPPTPAMEAPEPLPPLRRPRLCCCRHGRRPVAAAQGALHCFRACQMN